MTDAPLVTSQLTVDGTPPRLERVVDDIWTFSGRVVGSYTAALALVAAAAAVPPDQRRAWSFHLVYDHVARSGVLELQTDVVRTGRSSSCVDVRIVQGDDVIVRASVLFGQADLAPPPTTSPHVPDWGTLASAPADPPHRSERLLWRDTKRPFDAFLERRGIDFPTKREDFRGRPPGVSLWIRSNATGHLAPKDVTTQQALDLLYYDMHTAETPVESLGADPRYSFTLDFTAWWYGVDPISEWRQLTTSAAISSELGIAHAALRDESGQLVSGAVQCLRIAMPRDAGGDAGGGEATA